MRTDRGDGPQLEQTSPSPNTKYIKATLCVMVAYVYLLAKVESVGASWNSARNWHLDSLLTAGSYRSQDRLSAYVVVTKARELRLRFYLSLSKLGSSPMALFHSSCGPLVFCQQGISSQLEFISIHSIYRQKLNKRLLQGYFFTALQHTDFFAFVFLPFFLASPSDRLVSDRTRPLGI